MLVQLSAKTDVGLVRKGNEDTFLVTKNVSDSNWVVPDSQFVIPELGSVVIVADGMGGEAAGEVASEIAVMSIKKYLLENLKVESTAKDISFILKNSLIEANEHIKNHMQSNPDTFGMGTTATICYIKGNQMFICWVGDSRVYRYSTDGRVTNHSYFEKNLEILTNDHSLVWEEVQRGKMTPEEARVAINSNVITQSLGDMYRLPKPDITVVPLYQNDIILSCSDGLNGMISDSDIHDIISQSSSIDYLSDHLFDAAKQGGGKDNITIALLKVINGLAYPVENVAETIEIRPDGNDEKKIVEDITEVETSDEIVNLVSSSLRVSLAAEEEDVVSAELKEQSKTLKNAFFILLISSVLLGISYMFKDDFVKLMDPFTENSSDIESADPTIDDDYFLEEEKEKDKVKPKLPSSPISETPKVPVQSSNKTSTNEPQLGEYEKKGELVTSDEVAKLESETDATEKLSEKSEFAGMLIEDKEVIKLWKSIPQKRITKYDELFKAYNDLLKVLQTTTIDDEESRKDALKKLTNLKKTLDKKTKK